MDIADRALKDIEMMDSLISKREVKPEAEATGKCLWCGRKVRKGRRWCDRDCCAAWEREQKKNGRT